MVDKYIQPCFDSSVFLGGLNGEICNGIKRKVVFDWLWRQAQNGKFKVFISAMTLAEVYKLKRRTDAPPADTRLIHVDEFLECIEEEFVEVIEINRRTGLLANSLCRKHNISPCDGLQLASAIEGKCDVLLAWDVPLIGKTEDGIRIESPCMYDADMFDKDTELASEEEIDEYEKSKITTVKTVEPELRRGNGEFVEDKSPSEDGKTVETIEVKTQNEETNGNAAQVKRSDA